MTRQTVKLAAYAQMHGVTRQAAYKWRDKGLLVFVGDLIDVEASNGLIAKYRDPALGRAHTTRGPKAAVAPVAPRKSRSGNVGEPRATLEPPGGRANRAGAIPAPSEMPGAPSPSDPSWPPDPPLPPVAEARPDSMRSVLGGDNLRRPGETPDQAVERILGDLGTAMASTEEARRVKENYLALRGKLEYERDAGELVDLKTAEAVLFEAARSVRNVWLSFPMNFGAEIAADLGTEADRTTDVLTGYVHRQIAALGEPNAQFGEG